MNQNSIQALISCLFAFMLATRVRRTLGLALIVAVPYAVPVYAQFGIPAIVIAAARVVDFITNTLGPILSSITGAMRAVSGLLDGFWNLWKNVVYPIAAIARATSLATSLVARFRGLFDSLARIAVYSATIPNPIALENVMRSRSSAGYSSLNTNYTQVYRPLPPSTMAHPIERDLMDMDDATAKALLKTLMASEQVVDQTIGAAESIEDEAQFQAPGSAAYLSGAGITAAVRSQAMMMRMIAAEIRQEAAKLGHDNNVRKRNATFADQFRKNGADVLRRP